MPVLQLRREMLPRVISGEVHNMRIPVMDKNRVPLMPCTSARARKLLNQGKASAYWNKLGIFCIILNKEVEPNNQKLVVGIDPGSKFEGWSVVGTEDTVLNGMSETPIHIKKAVEVRRNMRRARRHRNLWRREARFNNRLRNKDSLPPSTLSRWQAKYRILEQLLKVLPISDVVVEDVNAATKNGSKKWNLNFSPIQHGKNCRRKIKRHFHHTLWMPGLWLQVFQDRLNHRGPDYSIGYRLDCIEDNYIDLNQVMAVLERVMEVLDRWD